MTQLAPQTTPVDYEELDPVTFSKTIKRVVVSDEISDHPETRKILDKAKHFKIPVVDNLPDLSSSSINQKFRAEKQTLYLRLNRGSFIKPWPAHLSLIGEDELCLTPVEGCAMDCSYCYLQSYLDRPLVQVYVNQEEMIDHITGYIEQSADRAPYSFSLGELSDGLFLEPLLGSAKKIWDLFQTINGSLEIRTKSHHVHSILENCTPHKNAVLCWSLSPSGPDRRDEMLTSSLEQRLTAMKASLQKGFKVGARIDPVILRTNWKNEYNTLINDMSNKFDINELAYLIIGTFRFPAGFDSIMEKRFKNRSFLQTEFVKSTDDTMRYPRETRSNVYQFMVEKLQDYGVKPQLCMEQKYLWEDSGVVPDNLSLHL